MHRRAPTAALLSVVPLGLLAAGCLSLPPFEAGELEDAGGGGGAEVVEDTVEAEVEDDVAVDAGPETSEADPLVPLSDEFDDPASLADWTSRTGSFEGVDVDTSTAGHLTVQPSSGSWYHDNRGLLLYHLVEGDFAIVADMTGGRVGAAEEPPASQFNAIGLMVRDPASGPGEESWVLTDLGMQDGDVGYASKSTVGSSSDPLDFFDAGHSGLLALCRRGAQVSLWRRLDGDADWSLTATFDRPDLPDEVQVGVMASALGQPADLFGTVDWVRFRTPETQADCTADGP